MCHYSFPEAESLVARSVQLHIHTDIQQAPVASVGTAR